MTTTSSFMSTLPALVMAFSVMLQGAARNRGRIASQYTSTGRYFFFSASRTKAIRFRPGRICQTGSLETPDGLRGGSLACRCRRQRRTRLGKRGMEFAEINGAGLRYEVDGRGERTLVLVHEMGGSLESWEDAARQFSKSRRVLRYDCRGAGLSQKVRGELSIDTMADDIAALLDHVGITGKVALAGVAVGGAVALHFAARHPARASAVAAGSPATGIAQDRRAAVLDRVAKLEAAGMAFAVEESMRNGYPDELRSDARRFEQFRARWLGNDPSSYATVWRMLASTDMQGELAGIRCPVLV